MKLVTLQLLVALFSISQISVAGQLTQTDSISADHIVQADEKEKKKKDGEEEPDCD